MSGNILPFTEANSKRIASLFRKAMRSAFDNTVKFDAYRNATINIRQRIEANRHVSDAEELEQIVKAFKAELKDWEVPDPYIPPCRPGGTKFYRNAPDPRETEKLVPGDW